MAVTSYGAITLSNITANDNGQPGGIGHGVILNNEGFSSNADGSGDPGSTLITRSPVTLTGINTFDDNHDGGLDLTSAGAVALSNVTASSNGSASAGDGVGIINNPDWYPNFTSTLKNYSANVTLSGFGIFENDHHEGLSIVSKGAVTLANLTANSNGDNGASIQTHNILGPQNVTLTGSNSFYGNSILSSVGDGLFVQNSGAITISNLSASGNKAYGAYLDNFTNSVPGKFLGVTLTGFNTFENNQGTDGLYVHTDGSAVMSHVNADNNTGTGVLVNATKNITVMCASAYGNNQGFSMVAGPLMTLIGVHSFYNTLPDVLFSIHENRTWACP